MFDFFYFFLIFWVPSAHEAMVNETVPSEFPVDIDKTATIAELKEELIGCGLVSPSFYRLIMFSGRFIIFFHGAPMGTQRGGSLFLS